MSNQRQVLRKEMKLVTSNLDVRWTKVASNEICEKLNDLMQSKLQLAYENIIVFQPLVPGSVDLTYFVTCQLSSGKRIFVPSGTKEDYKFFNITSEFINQNEFSTVLLTNQVNKGEDYSFENALQTVVILPGLAFDHYGNRIGWGKLHYEYLFRKPNMGHALKVGVCFELQFQKEIPAGNTDLIVDWVCHEREIIKTGLAEDPSFPEEEF